jgi:dolichyl-phosphate-mannose--protein O-mannosyl transferase
VSDARRELALRFVVSFFNALVAALVVAALYTTASQLGVSTGAACAAALVLAFTTPLWVYAKSFMAEPLEAL